jgi:hypothetical protein
LADDVFGSADQVSTEDLLAFYQKVIAKRRFYPAQIFEGRVFFLIQPLFRGEYDSWNFEPGSRPGSSRVTRTVDRGRCPLQQTGLVVAPLGIITLVIVTLGIIISMSGDPQEAVSFAVCVPVVSRDCSRRVDGDREGANRPKESESGEGTVAGPKEALVDAWLTVVTYDRPRRVDDHRVRP